jgi:arsenate reductase
MAEGLLQHYGAWRFEVFSAGSAPSGKINDGAIATLKRHNINANYDAFKSQSWDDFAGTKFDIVITVCDNAAGEVCPAFLGEYKKLHWSIPDPSKVTGTEAEIKAAFDAAFEMLKERVERELLAIPLSINNCFKILDQSFNRIKYFSCIVDSLDSSCLPSEWVIKQKNSISYTFTEPQGENEKQRILEGLRHFMQCYLVRDCIESFAIALDKLFHLLLVDGKKIHSQQTLDDVLSKDEKELLKKFKNEGLSSKEGKIQLLHQHFCLDLLPDQKAIITSLKDIRNCFAHGNGIVRKTDGKKDTENKRKFCWKTVSVFAVGSESGKRYSVEFNQPFPEAGNICMQIVDHCKLFKIGEQMTFSSVETYEIALSLHLIAHRYISEIARIKSRL